MTVFVFLMISAAMITVSKLQKASLYCYKKAFLY